MDEIKLLERRLVNFLAWLLKDSFLPPTICLGSMVTTIMSSAVCLVGGQMLAVLGRRGGRDDPATLTPGLRAATENAIASLHHPEVNFKVVALALRELFECIASEYPALARSAVKRFLRLHYEQDLRLFSICAKDDCEGEAFRYYCKRHDQEADEQLQAATARISPEQQVMIEEDVEEMAREREEFEESIRRRFSRRRMD